MEVRVARHQPDLVALEDYSLESMNMADVLGEATGVFKLLLHRYDIKLLLVPPKTLKLFTAASGSASKARMIAAVAKHYGVVTKYDDVADAVGLAKFAEVWLTGVSTRRCELEAVRSLRAGKPPKKRYKVAKHI
jgi:Holliday junction resolvasome RuvABC endonuclease subunit